jgi:acyl-CoA thioester hydrolase
MSQPHHVADHAGAALKNSAISEARLRVRYVETDQMGVVYHANYLIWFEVGRVELLRQMGFSYREMEANDGVCIAVIDARCRYKAPARYDDEIIVRTQLEQMRESVIRFTYEVLRANDNTLLAEGDTTHVVVDMNMKKTRLPKKYADAFRAAMESS